MTSQVTSSNLQSAPVGAYSIGGSSGKIEPGKIVVCPPQNIYKYSLYDELHLGNDYVKELWYATEPKSVRSRYKVAKNKQRISKIVNWALLLTGGIFALRYRNSIKNFCKTLATKLGLVKK